MHRLVTQEGIDTVDGKDPALIRSDYRVDHVRHREAIISTALALVLQLVVDEAQAIHPTQHHLIELVSPLCFR